MFLSYSVGENMFLWLLSAPVVREWHSFILPELVFSTHRYFWMALGIFLLVQYEGTGHKFALEHSPEEKIQSYNFKIF